MVNAQEWLDKNYSKENRKNLSILIKKVTDRWLSLFSCHYEHYLEEQEILEGKINLNDFVNLEKLEIVDQRVSGLVVDRLVKLRFLYCYNNKFLLKLLGLGSGLEELNVEFCSQLIDLDISRCIFLKNFCYRGVSCYYLVSQVWEMRKKNKELKKELDERISPEEFSEFLQTQMELQAQLEQKEKENILLKEQLEVVLVVQVESLPRY